MAAEVFDRTFDPSVIERVDIDLPDASTTDPKLAFVLRNVLSREECERLIALSERNTYSTALINIGGGRQVLMTDVRNNDRYIRDDEEMADVMFQRLRPFLPTTWKNSELVSLNERLRFLRYDPGQRFEPHYDGTFQRKSGLKAGERSYITVQLYLNEGFEGGETTFLSESGRVPVAYVPETGSVLIFQHRLLHEGSAVRSGRKYTIRTDVMYRPRIGRLGMIATTLTIAGLVLLGVTRYSQRAGAAQ